MDNGAPFGVHLAMEFTFDEQKNRHLMATRGVGFQDVIDAIGAGDVLEVLENPNQDKYPRQMILVVRINDYPHCVPADVHGERYDLKTVYPCRKFRHLMEGESDD